MFGNFGTPVPFPLIPRALKTSWSRVSEDKVVREWSVLVTVSDLASTLLLRLFSTGVGGDRVGSGCDFAAVRDLLVVVIFSAPERDDGVSLICAFCNLEIKNLHCSISSFKSYEIRMGSKCINFVLHLSQSQRSRIPLFLSHALLRPSWPTVAAPSEPCSPHRLLAMRCSFPPPRLSSPPPRLSSPPPRLSSPPP